MIRKVLLLLIFISFPLSSICFAQGNATDGALNGYITDPSGAAIPNAHVVVRDLSTNITADTVSDSTGYYRFPILKVGKYGVAITAPGFSDLQQAGTTLTVGSDVRNDVKLGLVGSISMVEVLADASILDSSTPTVGATLDSTALRALPITSRNVYTYQFFSPGVKGYPTSTFSSPAPASDGTLSTQLLLDGLDNTQRSGTNPIRLVITTPEVVDQIQIISNGAPAMFGRTAGGTSTIVSRRGGDEFHGQVQPGPVRA